MNMIKRRTIKQKFEKVTKELENSKLKSHSSAYKQGINVAINKIKELQKSLLYEQHEFLITKNK